MLTARSHFCDSFRIKTKSNPGGGIEGDFFSQSSEVVNAVKHRSAQQAENHEW